jgi:hypothetical protein
VPAALRGDAIVNSLLWENSLPLSQSLKNDPFQPKQFAERPCLKRAATRCVRRFGVTNFGDVTQAGVI